jgi:competence protein ComEA
MSEQPSTAPIRARDALDRLLRPVPRRRLADLAARIRAVERPWLAVAAIAVLALAAGAWVMFGDTPAPVEVELPRATPGATASSGGSGSTASVPSGRGSATTSVPQSADIVVDVVGAVVRPGLVTVGAGSRVADAVVAAGGGRHDADLDQVNLAQPLTDGVRVVIPVIGQPPAVAGVAGTTATGTADGSAPSGPIDLNTATAEQLDSLPGVGPATAKAIVDHRTKNGPFRSVDDLLDVRGIGPAKLDALRDSVTASGR